MATPQPHEAGNPPDGFEAPSLTAATSGEQASLSRAVAPGLTVAALGVVYGDIGTSPLYAVRQSLIEFGETTRPSILGVISLILWSLILVVTVKYVFVIMRADNRGEKAALRSIRRLRLLEQLGLPQGERGVIGDRAQPVDRRGREQRISRRPRDGDDAEHHVVRHQRRKKQWADSQRWQHAHERTSRAAEIVHHHYVARPKHFAGERTRQREARAARRRKGIDRRDQLALVGHGFEHAGPVRATLRRRRVAQNGQEHRRVGDAGHLPREPAQRLGLAVGQSGEAEHQPAVGVATHLELDHALGSVTEREMARCAVAARRDQRVEQWRRGDRRTRVIPPTSSRQLSCAVDVVPGHWSTGGGLMASRFGVTADKRRRACSGSSVGRYK